MKLAIVLLASTASALSIPSWRELVNNVNGQSPFTSAEQYLIQLSPTDTRWVTEDEKWQLRREGIRFFDVTDHASEPELGLSQKATVTRKVTYPKKPVQNETISELLKQLDKKNMREHLETFTCVRYTPHVDGVR